MKSLHARQIVIVRPIITCLVVCALTGALAWVVASHALAQGGEPSSTPSVFTDPTYSSPIALSSDNAYVWAVNPDDDSVSVIRADSDLEVARIGVGDEPQSVAVDPEGEYVYVANAADNTVTVIRVTSKAPFDAVVEKTYVTGAEPWNIVISPDGKRVFVANSVQDTITIIKADVNYPVLPSIIGNVTLDDSACNAQDVNRHFQPRGMAVTVDNTKMYVTRFLSFVKPGGVEGTDTGKEGLVCRLDINTSAATTSASVTEFTPIALEPQLTGFNDANNKPTSAYANQMQSIVIRGNRAYLPNIAASPSGPLKFNVDTQAFVNSIGGVTGGSQTDLGALNLNLGARVPEGGKNRLFFANPWAIAFTNQSGAGNAYVVSAGSDLLVKLNVDASGVLTFTGGVSTARYVDLGDPNNATTSGRNAGKNPLGLVIRNDEYADTKAYVMNYVGRSVTVVNLTTDAVSSVIPLQALPVPGTTDEQQLVGKEIFFSTRGNFERPPGTTVATTNRLSSEGWQACASCHFNGWTDGTVWKFAAGPRKSVPLNGTWSPHDPDDQRILNYSAIFDEVQDFEANIRNVSGPGPVSGAFDKNHGLIIGDTGDINSAPTVVNAFGKANAGRPQLTVKLAGSGTSWPALDALKEWVRFGIRTPNGALTTTELSSPTRPGITGNSDTTGGLSATNVVPGRRLFLQAGCATCHGGSKWSLSSKDFISPPVGLELATEGDPLPVAGNPVSTTQYLHRFLFDVGSFNLNVNGNGNLIAGTNAIGAEELNEKGLDGLGKDYNADGKGIGFNIPSLLGIWHLPPYYHNGACETLACAVANTAHRRKGLLAGQSDPLNSAGTQADVVEFLKTLDANTAFPLNLYATSHNIFFDPPTVLSGRQTTVGVNLGLFGTKTDLSNLISDLGAVDRLKVRITINSTVGSAQVVDLPISAADFDQAFGVATISTTVTIPNSAGIGKVTVEIDPAHVLPTAAGDSFRDNTATRLVLSREASLDTNPPAVGAVFLSDDGVFNDNDAVVTTTNVKVKFLATDPGAPTTGVGSYCIVRYHYDTVLRRWVETSCTFQPVPAPVAAGTFIVNETIPPDEGTAYAFVWVKDNAGNISRTPGFDAVSFIPADAININRNDVDVFRLLLLQNQTLTFTTSIAFGDVDLSAFDGVGVNAARIGISAKNGTATESVAIKNTSGNSKLFQIEVRAAVNSRFTIATTQGAAGLTLTDATDIEAPAKDDSVEMLVGGPPALRTAIDEPQVTSLPLILR